VLHPRGVLTVAAALFVALALVILLAGTPSADVAVREGLLGMASPGVVAVMRLVTYAGAWYVLFPGTVMLVAALPAARRQWWIWCVLMVVAPIAEWVFKNLVRRARPEATSFAFPSGHATAAAAFFGAVVYLAGNLPRRAALVVRVVALAGIVLVGLSRIVLRKHWPADVLAGIALGLALTSVAVLIAERRDAQ
jgi:membrane-associated phospholipid phosphatase